MIIICEGLDKCGKSSFLQNLGLTVYEAHGPWGADTIKPINFGYDKISTIDYWYSKSPTLHSDFYPNNLTLHLGPEDTDPYRTMLKIFDISRYTDVYLDRSWISEMCYGKIYRDKVRLTEDEEEEIVNTLKRIPHQILWFDTNMTSTYFKRLDGNQYESNKTNIIRTHNMYKKIMHGYKLLGLNIMKVKFIIE